MKFFRTLLVGTALGIATAMPVVRQMLFEPTPIPGMIFETPMPAMSTSPVPVPSISMVTPGPVDVLPGEPTPMPAVTFVLRSTPSPPVVEPVIVTPVVLPETPGATMVPVVQPESPGATMVPVVQPESPGATTAPVGPPEIPIATPIGDVIQPSPSAVAVPSASASAVPSVAVPSTVPRDFTLPVQTGEPGLAESPVPLPTDLLSPNGPRGFSPQESPDPPGESAAVCFPATATVTLRDGSVKPMSDVQIGDSVSIGSGKFSDVFMFTHKLSDIRHRFVELRTSAGNTLQLTAGHYLHLNGKLAAASTARVGDNVVVADKTASVVDVKSTISRGLYNPQTVQGDIVVNGVLASTYTTAVHPSLGHALLTPFRTVYKRLGFSVKVLERGADMLANCMPKGQSVF